MAEPTQPWDEPTLPDHPAARRAIPYNPAYRPGVAPVGPRPLAPLTETIVPASRPQPPRPPLSYQMRQLRRGSEWSVLGGLFAFVCWGIWAISSRGLSLAVPVFTFILVLLVAGGVFALCRLLGRVVLERSMGRVRRGAWVSHAVTGLFLAAAGVAYLRQTEWVVETLTWLRGL
ncbi:MAG TPA: hypothetical protein VFM37_00425 [Pseudonocardiaceae bacterium]|nr:hypothetical protein [Pseudonocardiaceae bacterium]